MDLNADLNAVDSRGLPGGTAMDCGASRHLACRTLRSCRRTALQCAMDAKNAEAELVLRELMGLPQRRLVSRALLNVPLLDRAWWPCAQDG